VAGTGWVSAKDIYSAALIAGFFIGFYEVFVCVHGCQEVS